MTPDSSLRPQSTAYEHTRDAESSVSRKPVAIESTSLLATRSLASNAHRNIILASVLGTIGSVALVAVIFLLSRWWIRRRAFAEDMIIERPSDVFQDPQEKPDFQNPPLSPPPSQYTPDRTYFPNHPYALSSYSRNSIPPTPPPKDSTTLRPEPSQLAMPTFSSHPYTQGASVAPRELSTGPPTSTIYESFMSPDTPTPTPDPGVEPSPLASTAGGDHPLTQYDTTVSENTGPSSLSRSSSTPLRRQDHPYRR